MSRVKKKSGRFIGVPYRVAKSKYFAQLSPQATKLLMDLLCQYTGSNNGAQSACWALMKDRGWKSRSTLHRAKQELIDVGFAVVTRAGKKMRGCPTLLAITWNGIDICPGITFDEGVKDSRTPLGYWCKSKKAREEQPELRAVA